MRSHRIVRAVLAVAVLTFGSAAPATAERPTRSGEQINVLAGTPSTFAADTPFHVAHGWAPGLDDMKGAGLYGFALRVDGVEVPFDFRDVTVTTGEDVVVSRVVVFNFPDGLGLGTHSFEGRWSAPCGPAVAEGLYEGPCITPAERVVVEVITRDVDFRVPATITVEKFADPADGTRFPFELTHPDGTEEAFELGDGETWTREGVAEFGDYSLLENPPEGWQIDSASCEDLYYGAQMSPDLLRVREASDIVCSFTNSAST